MSPNSLLQAEIAFFAKCQSTSGGSNLPLGDILEAIRTGRWLRQIAEIRALPYPSPAYDTLKRNLPCFMLSGSTANGGHKARDILSHSGLLQIDVDGIERGAACVLRDTLASDEHILSSWLSPSGRGVKAALCIPPSSETHARAFSVAQQYVLEAYGVEIDRQCKDPCRLCFVSHDPELRLNEGASALNIEEATEDLAVEMANNNTVQRDRETEKQSTRETEGQSNRDTEELSDRVTDVVGWCGTAAEAVNLALPTKSGDNHRLLFLLARAVKALEVIDGPWSPSQLKAIFDQWHIRADRRYLKPDNTLYYMEFLAAYSSVKHPLGANLVEDAWKRAETSVMPPDIMEFSDSTEVRMALALCRELQRLAGDNPFFLAARTLSHYLGHRTHTTAAMLLRAFCSAQVLKVVQRGIGIRASRYRYQLSM